ncbi:hypothetical protein [Candidatus Methylopumilus rimovensis]|jgi:hypothetical protein|uniref:hypothetical protein n=1 Tax=Candidatus Methylopumilus rimovensis TaxID=2588535 RepID=UPI001CB93D15|nr:hypothetical protein [Candidatus Methylopumilus rimovensis]
MSTLLKKILFIFIALGISFHILAEGKKLYTENEFLDTFGAKSKERVLQVLGEPERKEMSVKPTNASSVIGRPAVDKSNPNKRVNIEMWYYANLVKSDEKNTWKQTELTIMDGKVYNIGFFNSR